MVGLKILEVLEPKLNYYFVLFVPKWSCQQNFTLGWHKTYHKLSNDWEAFLPRPAFKNLRLWFRILHSQQCQQYGTYLRIPRAWSGMVVNGKSNKAKNVINTIASNNDYSQKSSLLVLTDSPLTTWSYTSILEIPSHLRNIYPDPFTHNLWATFLLSVKMEK